MDATGWSVLIGAIVTGTVSIIGVYIRLRNNIAKVKIDAHGQIIANYQDLIVRSNALAEVFREELRVEKDQHRVDEFAIREDAKRALSEARSFFAEQLKAVTTEFTKTLRADRTVARAEAEENRKVIQEQSAATATEHQAIIQSLDQLKEHIVECTNHVVRQVRRDHDMTDEGSQLGGLNTNRQVKRFTQEINEGEKHGD